MCAVETIALFTCLSLAGLKMRVKTALGHCLFSDLPFLEKKKNLPLTSKKVFFPIFHSRINFGSSSQALEYNRHLLLSVTPVELHYLLFCPNYI